MFWGRGRGLCDAKVGALPLDVGGRVPVLGGDFAVDGVGDFHALGPLACVLEVLSEDLHAVVVVVLGDDVVFFAVEHVDLGLAGLGVLDGHLGVVFDDGRERGAVALGADVHVGLSGGLDDLRVNSRPRQRLGLSQQKGRLLKRRGKKTNLDAFGGFVVEVVLQFGDAGVAVGLDLGHGAGSILEDVGDLVAVRDALEVDVDLLGAVFGDDVAALLAALELVVVAGVKVEGGGPALERGRGLVLGGGGRRDLGDLGVAYPEHVGERVGRDVDDGGAVAGLPLKVHGGVCGVVAFVLGFNHDCPC